MLAQVFLASLLTSTPSYNWQVEDAWLSNVSYVHTRNGTPVSPLTPPVLNINGNEVEVIDTNASGLPAGTVTMIDDRLVTYDVNIQVRYTGPTRVIGSPISGESSLFEYGYISGGIGPSKGQSGAIHIAASSLVLAHVLDLYTVTPGVANSDSVGSTTYVAQSGITRPMPVYLDSNGYYAIFTTGAGFHHTHDLYCPGPNSIAGATSEFGSKFKLHTVNLEAVDPN